MAGEMVGDGSLPITTVGAWTLEKHERLIKYVTITGSVRKKFAKTETTYIELFSGPGRSILEETSEIVDGSPVLAVKTARKSKSPYSDIYLADVERSFVDAACQRLPTGAGRVHPFVGSAEETIDLIVRCLNPYGLHFAFLDPYKLDPMSFSVIEKLAKFKRMDMLIHVSVQDLQRNLRRYMDERDGPLDRFAPGWRDVVDDRDSDRNVRIAIFRH